MNELQKQLHAHLGTLTITASEIGHGVCENPYPIGRRAVYELYLGRKISDSHKWKMSQYFKGHGLEMEADEGDLFG